MKYQPVRFRVLILRQGPSVCLESSVHVSNAPLGRLAHLSVCSFPALPSCIFSSQACSPAVVSHTCVICSWAPRTRARRRRWLRHWTLMIPIYNLLAAVMFLCVRPHQNWTRTHPAFCPRARSAFQHWLKCRTCARQRFKIRQSRCDWSETTEIKQL